MSENSYSASIVVPQTPAEVYEAVRDARSWWNADIVGRIEAVGDEFTHEVPGLHTARFRVTEADPGRRMVWHVLDSVMTFLEDDKGEWVGTDIVYDIDTVADGTQLTFTHDGLVPSHDCYDICENAWGGYVASLHSLITTGAGRPNQERESA